MNFFWLGVEGELSVLLTMDWNITVGVWAIEMAQQEEKLTRSSRYSSHMAT